MDLPDCPPGAEGYQDSVTEMPKKPDLEEPSCTKAELEFQEHLNSLKIRIEDGSVRCMVERRVRDLGGKWIYLCYPCAAVCSGEAVLQTHLSGKKHKAKLSNRNVWPLSIFEEHPYNQSAVKTSPPSEIVLKRMAEEVENHNRTSSEYDSQFEKYSNVISYIQKSLDAVKAPLIGVEYLIEHPPEQEHYEPTYMCTLCAKQGHPRTIINHMTCFWHRYNYLLRHFSAACALLTPFRAQTKYREGVSVVMNRLAQRIEDKYGRKRPINIEKEEYEKNKDQIHQWIFRGHHFSEKDGATFEEVVDIGLIDSLHQSNNESRYKSLGKNADERKRRENEPSPPTVAAPKPLFNSFSRPAGRQERRADSVESLSDISDEGVPEQRREPAKPVTKERHEPPHRARFEPYPEKRRTNSPPHNRHVLRKSQEKQRAPNYEYKIKLAEEKRLAAEDSAKKTLAYHEKNPEKHPLYPEEWKKFWNKRYKEIQAEGKDPSKHDFKPEWILFWTARMKDLHEEELRVQVNEIYRKMCLSPPDMNKRPLERPVERHRSPERRRSPEPRRRSPERYRAERHARVEPRARDLPPRRRSPDYKRDRRRSPPHLRRSPGRRRSSERRRSPLRHKRTRSRSPLHRRSPARTHIALESLRRSSRSPLSQREGQPRNRSPEHSRSVAPSMQTVLISDDELKPDDGLSPWNSDNDIESVVSGPSLASLGARSAASRRARAPSPHAADDVVATLRLLVALEDYLGSLGPRVVDLLADALTMEKERANSSEELLERDSALVLLETAKEKLKGAAQAGLVSGSAAAAVRAAVVRVAATLHEADKRAKRNKQENLAAAAKPAVVPVAGVGEVDRAQIAQQMAAALIAQGKTDVSSEELAQLVDAVVGMAEAKKRETEKKKEQPAPAAPAQPVLAKLSGTASALQMLQSAYDENDKKTEKDDVPDAMDGLSDSDLETLLKNFNELSAEEQHSLIAYLKKLEAKEPQRVERLRQYVSDAATVPRPPPPAAPPAAPAPAPPVTIDSDDDDYTVEEVFKSATQKVKEDQIRQEMEIVKKSLEEVKPEQEVNPTTLESSLADITKNLSSATDLFALVQASLKSTPTASHAPLSHSPGVVVSATQPRSFGDLSEAPASMQQPIKSLLQNTPMHPAPLMQRAPILPSPPQNVPMTPTPLLQNLPVAPALLMTPNQGQLQQAQNSFHNQQGGLLRPQIRHQAAPQQHYQQQHYQQQGQQQQLQQQQHQHQQQQHQQQQHQQQQPQQQHLQQQQQHQQQQPQQQHLQQQQQHQQQQPQQQHLQQQQQHQQQPHQQHHQPHQQHQQQQQYKPPQNQQQYHNQHQQQDNYQQNNFNDNRNKMNEHHQGQWNQRNNNMSDNRGPSIRGSGSNNTPYNQGPRNNFMNGRGQDNYDTRPQNMNNQFGGFDNQQNNFRGRGRGQHGGMRGRGRGYY